MTAADASNVRDVLATLRQAPDLDGPLVALIERALGHPSGSMAARDAAWRVAHALAVRRSDRTAVAMVESLGRPWPSDTTALLALAIAALRGGFAGTAASLAAHVLDLAPASGDLRSARLVARSYRLIADAAGREAALARAEQDRAERPGSAAHAFARAQLLSVLRRHAAALAAYAECRRLAPAERDFHIAHAEAALRTAPPEEALGVAIEGRRRWPGDPVVLHQASLALRQVGDVAGAIEAARAALSTGRAPRTTVAHLLGLLVREGAIGQALDVLEQALDEAEPPQELGPVAAVLRASDDEERVRRLAGRLLRWRPYLRDAPWLAAMGGRDAVRSGQPVGRRRILEGAPPPPHVFAAFAGKGHQMHGGSAPPAAAADIDLLDLGEATLHVFPFGFLVTDRDGLAYDLATPNLHADLVEFAAGLPLQAEFPELVLASDGRYAANNYCHWLLDYLPRILWAARLRPGIPIGVPGVTLDGFRAASLDHIGFDRTTLRALPNGRYRIGRLTALSNCDPRVFRNALHGGNPAYARPLLDAFALPETPGHRRIFLTRPPGSGRSFTNYEAAMSVVAAAGFEVVDPGRHAFAAQLRMMGEAAAVAGPHGAGLTNLLFCPPRTRVLEIFPRDNGTLPFAMVSAIRGHDYAVLVGEPPPLAAIQGVDSNRADFTVDPAALADALARLSTPPVGGRIP